MKRFDATFEVCVALLRGDLLKHEEANAGAWGVIDTSKALGVFDATSDAWCGPEGLPGRYTREEAELRARRLSGSSEVGTAYCAMELPAPPRIIWAGRHCSAVDERLQFECVDWSQGPSDVVAVGSAFDAALAFVGLVGERAAYSAVFRGEERKAA